MKKRIFALLLALAMVFALAACSTPAVDDTNPDETDSIDVDLSQDVLTFSAGSELLNGGPLLTVNGTAVSNPLLLYWIAVNCSYFESNYGYYGLTVEDYADLLFSDSISMATYYSLLEQKTVENGCPLTDDQLEAINTAMDIGSDDYNQRIDLYGFSEDDLRFIYSMEDLYNNLLEALTDEPTDEDLNNYVYQARHILISTVDMEGEVSYDDEGNASYPALDEETVAEKTALAQNILTQLQACETQEELETLFHTLMTEHSEDGRDQDGKLYSPEGYTATVGEMVLEFEEAALALEPGQLSGLVETMYGYHIILRGEVEDLADYAEEYRSTQMDTLLDQWLKEADVVESDALETLDVAEMYARYVAWQAAYLDALPDDSEE